MSNRRVQALEEVTVSTLLAQIAKHRYPERDRAALLLNVDAGLTAEEIARVTWGMALEGPDGSGARPVANALLLEANVRPGSELRCIPMTRRLRDSLVALNQWYSRRRRRVGPQDPILLSERAGKRNDGSWAPMKPNSISRFFLRLSERSGITDCTTMAGRRAYAKRLIASYPETPPGLEDSQADEAHAQALLRKYRRKLHREGSSLTGHKNPAHFARLLED